MSRETEISSSSRRSTRNITPETPLTEIYRYLNRKYDFPIVSEIANSEPLVNQYHELTKLMHTLYPRTVLIVIRHIRDLHAQMTRPHEYNRPNRRPRPPKWGSEFALNLMHVFVTSLERERQEWQKDGGSSRGNFGSSASGTRTSCSLSISSDSLVNAPGTGVERAPLHPPAPTSSSFPESRRFRKVEKKKETQASSSRSCVSEESRSAVSGDLDKPTRSASTVPPKAPERLPSDEGRFDDPDSIMLDDSSVLDDGPTNSLVPGHMLPSALESENMDVHQQRGSRKKDQTRKRTVKASISISSSTSINSMSSNLFSVENPIDHHPLRLPEERVLEDADDESQGAGETSYSPPVSPVRVPMREHLPRQPSSASFTSTSTSATSLFNQLPGSFPISRGPSSVSQSSESTSFKRKDESTATNLEGKRQKTAEKPSTITKRNLPAVPLFNEMEPSTGNRSASTSYSSSRRMSIDGGDILTSQEAPSTAPTSFNTQSGGPPREAYGPTSASLGGEIHQDSDTEADEEDPWTRKVPSGQALKTQNEVMHNRRKTDALKQDMVDGGSLYLRQEQLQFCDDVVDKDDQMNAAGPATTPYRLMDGIGIPSSSASDAYSLASTDMRALADMPDPSEFSNLPFHRLYEATRVALHHRYSMDHKSLEKAFCQQLPHLLRATSLEDFWAGLQAFGGGAPMPLPIAADVWNAIEGGEWSNEIELSGEARFDLVADGSTRAQRTKPGVVLTLKPLKNQHRSSRFTRKFGSDRFLAVKIPFVRKDDSSIQQLKQEDARTLLDKWILGGFELAGRVWEPFVQRSPKRETDSGEKNRKMLFFAVSGKNIPTISIQNLSGWLISVELNANITAAKFMARHALGLSVTVPCIMIPLKQVRFAPDTKAKGSGEVMDDGCALASPAVFRAIREKLGLTAVPSAVQARYGGAKGVWMMDPDADPDSDEVWIQIRDSQLKYNFHREDENEATADPARLTLEVCNVAKAYHGSAMNKQLIPILYTNGVPREVFRELVREDIQKELGFLRENIEIPAILKKWLEERMPPGSNSGDSITKHGPASMGIEAAARQLLDAGFAVSGCSYLWKLVKQCVHAYGQRLMQKMHITVPRSAKAICVADPTGTLKEGEISFRFSESKVDEQTGLKRDLVEGEVLVARNPAYARTDIRKVTAVDNHRLRHLKDVVVFSTQGEKPLASYLSGGDYDGDIVWVCWEPRVVQNFTNADPSPHQFEELAYFEEDDTAKTLVDIRRFLHRKRFDAVFFKKLWDMGLKSSLPDSYVGKCSHFFERFTYNTRVLDSLAAINIIGVIERVLDAPKQGKKLKVQNWHRLVSSVSSKLDNPRDPLYFENEPRREEISDNAQILDFVKFRVSRMFVKEILQDLDKRFKSVPAADTDLTRLYKNRWHLANNILQDKLAHDLAREGARQMKDLFNCLYEDLDQLEKTWARHYTPKVKRPLDEETAFKENIFNMYRDIQPRFETDPEIIPLTTIYDLLQDWEKDCSAWNMLKASTAFYRFKGERKLVWYLAGRELCFIKAQATLNPFRIVQDPLYDIMRTKGSLIEATQSSNLIDLGEETGSEESEDMLHDANEFFLE